METHRKTPTHILPPCNVHPEVSFNQTTPTQAHPSLHRTHTHTHTGLLIAYNKRQRYNTRRRLVVYFKMNNSDESKR